MKRAWLAVALGVTAGCAAIADINRLEPPPDGGSADGGGDEGVEGGEGGCGPAAGVTTLARYPRGVHTALDATDVYFTSVDPPRDSAILRCSKCGCAAPTVIAAKVNQPGGIAVDEDAVFWTDSNESGSLNRAAKADPTQLRQVIGQESPVGVAVDTEFVYWTVVGGGPKGVSTAGVYRARKSDLGEVTRLASADTLPSNLVPYALAVDDTYVYYTTAPDLNDQDPQQPCTADAGGKTFGSVRRVAKRGGAMQSPTVLASGQACPLGLALDATTVYWSNLGAGSAAAGSVWRVAKSGGAAAQLAGAIGRPTSLALSGGRLSWNVPVNQRIESCSLPACADVASLAADQRNPSGLSADASGIYWAALGSVAESFMDGALRRASMP